MPSMADLITDKKMNTILTLIKNVNQGEDSYYNNLGAEMQNFLHGPQGEANRKKVNLIYDQITHGKVGGNSTKTRKRKKRKRRSTRTKRGGNPLFLIAFVALSIYLCGSGDGDRDEGSPPPPSTVDSDDPDLEYIKKNKARFPSTKNWTPEQIAAKKAKSAARLRTARRVKFSPSTKSAAQSRDMHDTRKSRRGWGGTKK